MAHVLFCARGLTPSASWLMLSCASGTAITSSRRTTSSTLRAMGPARPGGVVANVAAQQRCRKQEGPVRYGRLRCWDRAQGVSRRGNGGGSRGAAPPLVPCLPPMQLAKKHACELS